MGSVGQLTARVAAHLGFPRPSSQSLAGGVEHLPDVRESLLLGRERVAGKVVQVPAVG